MDAKFWHERWDSNRIGFHQSEVNESLTEFWPHVAPSLTDPSQAVKTCVFVPLCGKSLDMLWLHQQGHSILGVELSALAAEAFFTENALGFERHEKGEFIHFQGSGAAQGITIIAGDFFRLTAADIAVCGLFYDRAALIAMKPDMRAAYTDHLAALMSAGSQGLLVTMSYDQARMPGPPFSVPDQTVRQLLGPGFTIEQLAHHSGPDRVGNLTKRGLETMDEWIYLLSRKC